MVGTVNKLVIESTQESRKRSPGLRKTVQENLYCGKHFTHTNSLCVAWRLGVFQLPPDGMLVYHRVTPHPCQHPFILLGGKRHCQSRVSSPRTQHNINIPRP